jgi:hypothetical protein
VCQTHHPTSPWATSTTHLTICTYQTETEPRQLKFQLCVPNAPPCSFLCSPHPTTSKTMYSHSKYPLYLHHKFHACQSDIEHLHSISVILEQYAHELLDPSIHGSHNLKNHVHTILHMPYTYTTSFMHIECICLASAFCGATYPPPTHSLNPQLPPSWRPCTPDSTHILHPHHKFYACQSDTKHVYSISTFWGQHAHPPHVLSISSLHHLEAHMHSTLHTSYTPTICFMCSGPTLSAYAQCLPLGVKYPTQHLFSPTRHPTIQTLTSTSSHTLPLSSLPYNSNGQVILSAYTWYMAVQVNFPAPHLSLHCGLPLP